MVFFLGFGLLVPIASALATLVGEAFKHSLSLRRFLALATSSLIDGSIASNFDTVLRYDFQKYSNLRLLIGQEIRYFYFRNYVMENSKNLPVPV